MAKNKAKSENLQIAMHRLDSLLQEGFSKKKLANMTNIKYGTLGKIIRGCSKDITDINYNKIEKVYFNYLDKKFADKLYIENFLDEEPVIDSIDAEEGARTIAVWLGITVALGLLTLVGLAFVVKYIIDLL
jgi:hypothetical protein